MNSLKEVRNIYNLISNAYHNTIGIKTLSQYILALDAHGINIEDNNFVTITTQHGVPITENNIRNFLKKFYHDSNFFIDIYNSSLCSKDAMDIFHVSKNIFK